MIVDMTVKFEDNCFYQYLRVCSDVAGLLEEGILVNWAVKDIDLYTNIVSGRKTKSCPNCDSVDHSLYSCPNLSESATLSSSLLATSSVVFYGGGTATTASSSPFARQTQRAKAVIDGVELEICENWNTNKCHRSDCKHHHSRMDATTPVNVEQLKKELLHHPKKDLVKFLLDGFSYGFDIGLLQLSTTALHCKNNSSARDAPEVVDKLIQDDVVKGFLLGLFTKIPFETYRISPIAVAYGKYSGKARLIVDLSAPYDVQHHSSINSLIDKEQYSLSYATLDDTLKIVNRLGPHTSMTKCDMVDAFKQVPVTVDKWNKAAGNMVVHKH
ncbi:unnamed protein product [Didymodactylos carnosus]|uniref:Uncharacterized protein n=1 Tax=Didymodactylos carnosus TaxID=1234261 RepID=A0A815B252_9BILA|nr:unnamed protein product [Didymodactylos carnosus]CAF4044517.1 unnamed protein product [Didymodactylos carnosus]